MHLGDLIMADDFEVHLIGLDDLLVKFKQIPQEVKRRSGRTALRRAANIVRDQLKANAERLNDPSTANSIADNVAVRFSSKRYNQTGDLMFRVGIIGGARQSSGAGSAPGGDTFYWRFLEFGTSTIKATPFARPAIEQSAQRATDEFIKQFTASLDRAIRRSKKGNI